MIFGYFDFGQASLLYNHQWFHDVDTALDRLVSSQLQRGPQDVRRGRLRGLVRRAGELDV